MARAKRTSTIFDYPPDELQRVGEIILNNYKFLKVAFEGTTITGIRVWVSTGGKVTFRLVAMKDRLKFSTTVRMVRP